MVSSSRRPCLGKLSEHLFVVSLCQVVDLIKFPSVNSIQSASSVAQLVSDASRVKRKMFDKLVAQLVERLSSDNVRRHHFVGRECLLAMFVEVAPHLHLAF